MIFLHTIYSICNPPHISSWQLKPCFSQYTMELFLRSLPFHTTKKMLPTAYLYSPTIPHSLSCFQACPKQQVFLPGILTPIFLPFTVHPSDSAQFIYNMSLIIFILTVVSFLKKKKSLKFLHVLAFMTFCDILSHCSPC